MRGCGVLPYVVEPARQSDAITAWAGLPTVLETMRSLSLETAIGETLHVRERESGYSEARKVEALVLLMAAGGDCLDDIEVLRADAGLCRLVGALPGADALRTFLYAFHSEELIARAQAARKKDQVAYIPEENEALRELAAVNEAFVGRVSRLGTGTKATLDHDATVLESHKREALSHYKGGRGYQPAVVYWAEQDLVVADEFRDGNVPAAMENLRLIRQAFGSLPSTVRERYFRADSACYDESLLKWLADPDRKGGPKGEIGFTISADMTLELRKVCTGMPETSWRLVEERAWETVHCAEVEFTPGNWSRLARPLRYLAVRFTACQGELFEDGRRVKYLAVVTNRAGDAIDLLRWHWQKAGTIEHLHDVTKNELGAGVPPCGRFGANAAWYRMSLLTYNVLSAMKSLALPGALESARPKRLRFLLFNIAGHIVTTGGRVLLRIAEEVEKRVQLIRARYQLREVLLTASPG
jgi:hypothetical protein